jgi:hypothetical protein
VERELTLRIVLESPPIGVHFGLQKGRGSNYETIQKQRSKTRDLHFECMIKVKAKSKGILPTFVGPFVQGPPGERFVYLVIGTCAGQTSTETEPRRKF